MTVAVKSTPELNTRSLFDSLAVASLAGVVYLLGSIAVLVKGLPALWWTYLGLSRDSFPAWAVLIVAMVAAAGGLIYLGGRLLGANPPPGIRAGVFVGFIGVSLVALIAKWIGGWIEYWSFDKQWFTPLVGVTVSVIIGLALLVLSLRFFFKPRFEEFLRNFEAQGWFAAASYKASQGLRVRRGTMLGIMILVGSGVWAYERSLQSGSENWEITVPFTGRDMIVNRGDAEAAPGLNMDWGDQRRILDPGDWPDFKSQQIVSEAEEEKVREMLRSGVKIREGDVDRFQPDDFIIRATFIVKKDAFARVQAGTSEKIASFDSKLPNAAPVLDRYYVRQKNEELAHDYLRITKASERDEQFKKGDVVSKGMFDEAIAKRQSEIDKLEQEAEDLKNKGDTLEARRRTERANTLQQQKPEATAPTPMEGVTQFQTMTLVPSVRFLVPLILGALALWLAWRMVNLPSFADFLIATEAELNKVSWTPRRRLIQDTVVVLVTTLLITVFLLFADVVWSQLLQRVGVLRAPDATGAEVQADNQELPW